MALIRIDRNPPRKQLRVFALLWLLFFSFVAVVVWKKTQSETAAFGLAALAVLVPAVGWVWSEFLRLAYLAMAYLAFPIGWVVSHVLLAGVYYLLFTPLGLILRVAGWDSMARRQDPGARSYWQARKPVRDVESYFRQF